MKNFKLLATLIVLLFTVSAFAQTGAAKKEVNFDRNNNTVKEIDAYVKVVDKFAQQEGTPHMVIADVADFEKADKAIWKKFESEDAFEKSQVNSYETAYLWKKDERLIAANITYSSPSGDWAQFVYYVFRADGSVARANRELRTFMGDIIVNRIYYYHSNGKLLKEKKTFRNLETKKFIKAPESFQDIDVDIYKTADKLPFESLIEVEGNGITISSDESKFVPNGWKIEAKTMGDLNGDKRSDSILQIINTNPKVEDYNRGLLILFKTRSGKFTKAAQSNKIIRCSSCGGMLGGGTANISVKKRVLTIEQMYGSRSGVNYLHRLRYEKRTKKFRLIGEDVNEFDRLDLTSENTSSNYLTGRQIIKTMKNKTLLHFWNLVLEIQI